MFTGSRPTSSLRDAFHPDYLAGALEDATHQMGPLYSQSRAVNYRTFGWVSTVAESATERNHTENSNVIADTNCYKQWRSLATSTSQRPICRVLNVDA